MNEFASFFSRQLINTLARSHPSPAKPSYTLTEVNTTFNIASNWRTSALPTVGTRKYFGSFEVLSKVQDSRTDIIT